MLRTRRAGGRWRVCLARVWGQLIMTRYLFSCHCPLLTGQGGFTESCTGARQQEPLIIFSLYLDPPSSVPSGARTINIVNPEL